MVEVDFSGNFLNAEDCKANDIGVIVDEGSMQERSKNGKTWNQLNITVNVNEKKYSHGFKTQEGRRFQEAYGKDTKAWIGKQFKVIIVPYVDAEKNIKQGVEIVPSEEKVTETQVQA